MFCAECGKKIRVGTKYCPSCGTAAEDEVQISSPNNTSDNELPARQHSKNEGEQWLGLLKHHKAESDRNWGTAFCLSLFLGFFGADRFYLGRNVLGTLKLCTMGAYGFWWLCDIVMLLLGKMKDSEGGILKSPFRK